NVILVSAMAEQEGAELGCLLGSEVPVQHFEAGESAGELWGRPISIQGGILTFEPAQEASRDTDFPLPVANDLLAILLGPGKKCGIARIRGRQGIEIILQCELFFLSVN